MSYCRTGPESDVYVYGDGEGLVCYVAHNRGSRIELPRWFFTEKALPSWLRAWILRAAWSRPNTRRLRSPHAGLTYRTDTAGEMAERLRTIGQSGLRVPQVALDRLDADA